MPDVSGIDLIEPIHDRDPETVCIVITGYATVELAVKAIKEGAYDFINKPFTAEDLSLAVNQGIERRRLSLESKRCALAEERGHAPDGGEAAAGGDRPRQDGLRAHGHPRAARPCRRHPELPAADP